MFAYNFLEEFKFLSEIRLWKNLIWHKPPAWPTVEYWWTFKKCPSYELIIFFLFLSIAFLEIRYPEDIYSFALCAMEK